MEAERKEEEWRIAREKAAKTRKTVAAIAIPSVVAIIAFIIVLIKVIIPTVRYNKAVEKYGKEWADIVKTASVGDTVIFGSYEQDNDASNGKEAIEWMVLDKKGMSLLLISKYALDCQKYNSTGTDITWEKCSLRTWLNGTFLNNAFSADEQAKIGTTCVSEDKNPNYGTNPENITTDKVFLLSIKEAENYFNSDAARRCSATAYAKSKGSYTNSGNGNCWWWLRSPGGNQSHAAFVTYGGSVDYDGLSVNLLIGSARPALWINLGS